MPLLTSPIDGEPMRQIHRYGIEIDVCPSSGGIWLDKGELEKLMHLLKEEAVNEQSGGASDSRGHQAYGGDEYRQFKEKGYYGSGKHKKKDSKMSQIMDLFDF